MTVRVDPPPAESSDASAAAAPAPAADAVASSVHALIRLHNLLIFLVFVCGLICVGIIAQRGSVEIPRPLILASLVFRIVFPLGALLATAVYTQAQLRATAADAGAVEVSSGAVLPLFRRCKLMSMILLALAGLIADALMLTANLKVIDLVLAVITLLLLVVTRPSVRGLEQFAAIVEMARVETPTASFRSREATEESGDE